MFAYLVWDRKKKQSSAHSLPLSSCLLVWLSVGGGAERERTAPAVAPVGRTEGERLLLHPGNGDVRVEHLPPVACTATQRAQRRLNLLAYPAMTGPRRLRPTAAACSASPATASRGRLGRGRRRTSRQLRTSHQHPQSTSSEQIDSATASRSVAAAAAAAPRVRR